MKLTIAGAARKSKRRGGLRRYERQEPHSSSSLSTAFLVFLSVPLCGPNSSKHEDSPIFGKR